MRQRLTTGGFHASIFEEVDLLASEAAAAQAAGDLRAVVAAGGDGTFRLLAERTPPGTPLTILPLGTENLLARYLELTAEPESLAAVIAAGRPFSFDAGRANGRLFALMAGCGFDADVVRRLHEQRQGHIQHLSYARPILDTIFGYEYPLLHVSFAPADAPKAGS